MPFPTADEIFPHLFHSHAYLK